MHPSWETLDLDDELKVSLNSPLVARAGFRFYTMRSPNDQDSSLNK